MPGTKTCPSQRHRHICYTPAGTAPKQASHKSTHKGPAGQRVPGKQRAFFILSASPVSDATPAGNAAELPMLDFTDQDQQSSRRQTSQKPTLCSTMAAATAAPRASSPAATAAPTASPSVHGIHHMRSWLYAEGLGVSPWLSMWSVCPCLCQPALCGEGMGVQQACSRCDCARLILETSCWADDHCAARSCGSNLKL